MEYLLKGNKSIIIDFIPKSLVLPELRVLEALLIRFILE